MRVKLGKETEQFQMMMDFWILEQEIWGIEDTPEYKAYACQEMDQFLAKHNTPMAEGLSRVLLDEMNRRSQVCDLQ